MRKITLTIRVDDSKEAELSSAIAVVIEEKGGIIKDHFVTTMKGAAKTGSGRMFGDD